MNSIASSATSVLIAHVASHTSTIRLGSGGIMLPNHAPLLIAEQFGTLETLHPGRIDLGLGRAPGQRSGDDAGDAPEPDVVGLLPAGRARVARLSLRADAHSRGQRHAGQRHRRAALHPRFFAVRRTARCSTGPAVRVRLALLAGRVAERRSDVSPRVPAVRAACRAARDRRRERHRSGHDRRGDRTAARRQSVPCRALPRRQSRLHRRRSRCDPRLPTGPAGDPDDALLGGRRSRRGRRATSTDSSNMPTPTS